MIKPLMMACGLALLSGCATTQPTPKPPSPFEEAGVRSVLVVPVLNNSLDVDAPRYLLSTLAVPLAARGYYVFPVNTVKILLEQEGFYEPAVIHEQDAASLASLFGADAIMYVTINRWDAQYAILATTVTVDFSYRVVTADGTEIWVAKQRMQYTPDSGQSSGDPLADLLLSALQAAVTRASPNYMPLAENANSAAISSIPEGPYAHEPTTKAEQAGVVPGAASQK